MEKMENVIAVNKKKKHTPIIIVAILVVCVVAALLIGLVARGGGSRGLQGRLDLGNKYLDELEYERALASFEAALNIDPMNVDAYLGIVEVYIRTGEFDKAYETAKEGYEATGDELLKEKMDMIESGEIYASNGWFMKKTVLDGDGNQIYAHVYTYNMEGEKTSVARLDENGNQTQYLELGYDKDGISRVSYRWDDYTGVISKDVEEKDGDGYHRIEYRELSDEIEMETFENADGNRVKEINYESDAENPIITDFELDAEGRETKQTRYRQSGEMIDSRTSEYDNAGNLIRETNYNSEGNRTDYREFTYTETGDPKEEWRYNGDGSQQCRIEWICDADGTCLEERWYDENDNLSSYTEYLYDKDGNYIEEKTYDGSGNLTRETQG